MTRAFATIGLAILISATAFGQSTPADDTPKFTLADIHPSPHSSSPQGMRAGFYKGGRDEVRYATMVDLISTAYGVDADKVLGGPNWLEFDHFDIIAMTPPKTTPDMARAMLQSLLADRFKLVIHTDKKEMPTYALTAGKKPLLKEADGTGETGCSVEIQGLPNNGRGGPTPDGAPVMPTFAYACRNITMATFAETLHTMILAEPYIGKNPIVEDTGLKGTWNFEIHYGVPAGNAPPGASPGLSMLDAVDKQLGLKLEPRKAPIPVITVDSVNEKPTDNLPGIMEKLPVAPTEFEVADIKPTDPNNTQGQNRSPFLPGGRFDIKGIPLKQLIVIAFDTTPGMVTGGPKFIDDERYDILAKAPAQITTVAGGNGMNGPPPVDIDALRLMLRALLIDRFKLKTHFEDQPMNTYTLVAAKPKLKKADPSNRTSFHEGPGPDGKDPRKESPQLGRLVTCQNMTMAQFAQLLPNIAGGYFQTVGRTVVDATGLEDAYDFTLSFSGAGILNGGGGGRGGDAPPPPSGSAGATATASDPSGGMTLMDAMEKQIGIKMETQKRPIPVLVIDHVEQKPTDN